MVGLIYWLPEVAQQLCIVDRFRLDRGWDNRNGHEHRRVVIIMGDGMAWWDVPTLRAWDGACA